MSALGTGFWKLTRDGYWQARSKAVMGRTENVECGDFDRRHKEDLFGARTSCGLLGEMVLIRDKFPWD